MREVGGSYRTSPSGKGNMAWAMGGGETGGDGAWSIGRTAHTPPLRLSAESGERMNQFADFENRQSGTENRKWKIEIRELKLENRQSPIANRKLPDGLIFVVPGTLVAYNP